ncbi:MAG: DUF1684 domain-containing protein [Chitinophagaceae bacterium]|nr:DUF1684 domain-containing protein [Chitinophagaceae bacterium]MCW5904436.1 DUF1684 domain-containing protein [Chitinophagaceae bacterium]
MKNSKQIILSILTLLFCANVFAQENYQQKIKAYQKNYVQEHEVVKGKDKKNFKFFKPNSRYHVMATFTKMNDSVGFIMKTSGTRDKKFFRYGIINFSIDNKPLQLTVYSSEQLMNDTAYKGYLFLPFTDLTSGNNSYGGGRYIDLLFSAIQENKISIDFNKAYNPYCVYAYGYNCPIPPKENHLSIAIKAGEKMYVGKKKERED